ncbi:MAG: NAD(P)-dependent oxidoreductase [Holosporales bacterium]|jgi:dTDP-6-deoxy-L-talose 4-dehydrogenase (NAD+)|nr:NAD(P)-dependent oxidoreductase [Holosporales bacterium]
MGEAYVLVTGGTGIVGRQVVKALVARKQKVRAVVRPGKEAFFYERGLSVETIRTEDLFKEGEDWMRKAYREVDTVIHCAWSMDEHRVYRHSPKNMVCLIGTLRLAQAAIVCGVRRFVGIGTFAEYDTRYGAALSVESPLLPMDLYGGTKVAAFYGLRDLLRCAGRSFAWCRVFMLHGEEAGNNIISRIRTRLAAGESVELTEGVVDFTDVAEAGRKIVEVALGERQGAVNICSGVPVSIRTMAEEIADTYERRDLLRFVPLPKNSPDFLVSIGVP